MALEAVVATAWKTLEMLTKFPEVSSAFQAELPEENKWEVPTG